MRACAPHALCYLREPEVTTNGYEGSRSTQAIDSFRLFTFLIGFTLIDPSILKRFAGNCRKCECRQCFGCEEVVRQ